MKKRYYVAVLTFMSVLCLCFALSGCSLFGGSTGDSGDHTHSYGNWVVTKEATCQETGKREHKCTGCGKVEEEVIPKSDHTYGKDNVCTVCGHELEYTIGLEYKMIREEISTNRYISGYAVTGIGTAKDRDIIIPAYHAGERVVKIEDKAFYGSDVITSVYISNGVDIIGEEAFYWCENLSKVTLAGSLEKIEACAFENCIELRSIAISGIKSIESRAFAGCTKLYDISLPDMGILISSNAFSDTAYYNADGHWNGGILYIGNHLIATKSDFTAPTFTLQSNVYSVASSALSNKGITTLIIPEDGKLGTIASSAFSNNQITTLSTPQKFLDALPLGYVENLTITGSGTVTNKFQAFGTLKTLAFGDNITAIDKETFSDCENLKSITFGNSLSWIKEKAFVNCTGLSVLSFPDSLKTISQYAFSGCTNVQKIQFGSGLTSIDAYAFQDCTAVTELTVPDSVNTIGCGAFKGMDHLESITLPFVGNTKNPERASEKTVFGYIFGCTMKDFAGWNHSIYMEDSDGNTIGYNDSEDGTRFQGILDDGVSNRVCWFYIPQTLKKIKITGGYVLDYSFCNLRDISLDVTMSAEATEIGKEAFEYCAGLKSIKIPDSVAKIGNTAFFLCSKLISVTIGSGVTSIGGSAFGYCRDLTSVNIPSGVNSIGSSAFCGCSGLTSVTIGSGVTSIGESAFDYCSGLTVIKVDQNNQTYHDFGNCLIETQSKNLIAGCKTSEIPDDGSVTSIGNDAFEGCDGLISIIIPDCVTEIGDSAFYGCDGLLSIDIPDNVTSIGFAAFAYCDRLTSVVIGNSVTSIGGIAFRECGSLQSVVWNAENCTEAGTSLDHIFELCTSLKSVIFGNDVKTIPLLDVFYECDGLEEIVVEPENPVYSSQDGILYNKAKTEFVYIPHAIKGAVTIPDGVTEIGERAFAFCSGLTSVTIGSGVTSIGKSAFQFCSGLTSVTIGSGVTSIGESAFEHCYGLTSITIPDSVTEIGESAFSWCGGLTSVTIGSGVTEIANGAFRMTFKLIEVWNYSLLPIEPESQKYGSVAASAKHIYRGQEKGHQTITDDGYIFYEEGEEVYLLGYMGEDIQLRLPEKSPGGKNYQMYNNAFWGCSKLTSVIIPDGVTAIGEYAFYSCSKLTSVIIPDGVTAIGECAFSGCSGLTSVIIPGSVTAIGDYAFYNCSGLTSVTIRNGVVSIGAYAFYNCSGLTEITIPDSVTSISGVAFENCENLIRVVFSDPEGWEVRCFKLNSIKLSPSDLSDPETAAKFLTVTYCSYTDGTTIYLCAWKKV